MNHVSTLLELRKVSRGASTLAAGFACQPFSRLGDERGGEDSRSLCLRGILAIGFYLQVHAIVLECVQPAALNSYVQQEIEKFQKCTGYFCSQQDLHLQQIWPARRSRAWWLITSPLLGKIQLDDWPKHLMVPTVRHLIPVVLPWDKQDEDELTLTEREVEAFGVGTETVHKYLLNFDACAPCALHSWGSQLHACQCGCRSAGLSSHRLREKGLFGCLLQSCPTELRESTYRHLHPNEVMMLCGYDPIIDFGPNPRLTLAAAGQMASPLQTAWVFATLKERIVQMQGADLQFKAEAQLHAFMTWLVMRGRQVWPAVQELITDSNSLSLVQFWQSVSAFSMHELMHPQRWPDIPPVTLTIASVLDHIIRMSQALIAHVPCPLPDEDAAMINDDENGIEDEPTPWIDPIHDDALLFPAPSETQCIVFLAKEATEPIQVSVKAGGTVSELIRAQEKLIGPMQVEKVFAQDGGEVSLSHALLPGQVLCIQCTDVFQSSPKPEMPSPRMNDESHDCPLECNVSVSGPVCPPDGVLPVVADISPTVPWTCLPHATEKQMVVEPLVKEVLKPPAVQPSAMVNDSWISAAPLLGLQSHQFLNLKVPSVVVNKHLEALRGQAISAADRKIILEHQEGMWAEDEFGHHIGLLLQLCENHNFAPPIQTDRNHMMLDPLLLTGWANHGHEWSHAWTRNHPEIKKEGVIVISACMIDGHWIPVVLTPNGDVLHFCTWDAPAHSHDALNVVVESIAHGLGFSQVSILRHQRIFFSSDKCGALAMAFLHHTVFNSMLPTCAEEADIVHDRLRAVFMRFVEGSTLCPRPWVWGAGDREDDAPFANEPGCSSTACPGPAQRPISETSHSHQCMPNEQRMDLLREKGKQWGDDEIRFHVRHLLEHPKNVTTNTYAVIPGFVMMDPLLLSTWETIGPALCEAWCRRNMEVPTKGFHIVAVFIHAEHWFPIWIVPHGVTLVAHVIEDALVDYQILQPMLAVLRAQFAFHASVLHTIPNLLPQHDMCGAAAIAFLGHVMVGADLPQTLEDLSDYHANMKAAFAQALFAGQCCICPVSWGSWNCQWSCPVFV